MSKLFVSRRTRAAAWVILLVLPALMAAFGYYHSHRPAVNPVGSRTFWDYVILNSDILLGLFFLLASAIPFLLVFDKKKPQARELVPIAVMAAIAVVGRTVFEIIPLPNFKPQPPPRGQSGGFPHFLGLHHIKLGYSAGSAVPAGLRDSLYTGI